MINKKEKAMKDKTYKEKTEEIMEAIRDGHKFYVETYIG